MMFRRLLTRVMTISAINTPRSCNDELMGNDFTILESRTEQTCGTHSH